MSSKLVLITALSCALGASGAFSIAGCSTKDDTPPPRNGVDDVQKACELRATWTKAADQKCINCLVGAPSAACDCEAFKDVGGLCKSQDEARRAEPTCTVALDDCTKVCVSTDCNCVAGCYAQAETCKRLSAAKDGCIADVCTPYCK